MILFNKYGMDDEGIYLRDKIRDKLYKGRDSHDVDIRIDRHYYVWWLTKGYRNFDKRWGFRHSYFMHLPKIF